jgi:hypothetical protein
MQALRNLHFWAVACRYHFALTAQAGFIVNQTGFCYRISALTMQVP